MADHLDAWVTRAQIIKDSGVKPTQVNNALKALRERHIILGNDKANTVFQLGHSRFGFGR